ncbi:1992_t:CDS:1, partial [Gigaspora margarita]
YCKYCNGQLKEIVYEIIEPDKTGYFERHYCGKCFRVFHFREASQRRTKRAPRKKEKKSKKTAKKGGGE